MYTIVVCTLSSSLIRRQLTESLLLCITMVQSNIGWLKNRAIIFVIAAFAFTLQRSDLYSLKHCTCFILFDCASKSVLFRVFCTQIRRGKTSNYYSFIKYNIHKTFSFSGLQFDFFSNEISYFKCYVLRKLTGLRKKLKVGDMTHK